MKLRYLLLLLFTGMFLVFAALQWNDPDPALWITVYVAAAGLCWLAYKRRLPKWAFGLFAFLFAVAAFFLWPPVYQGLTMDMNRSPAIEEARESLGLVICALAMFYCFLLTSSKHKKSSLQEG